MKKIALITDGWGRYVTYTWIQGYRKLHGCPPVRYGFIYFSELWEFQYG